MSQLPFEQYRIIFKLIKARQQYGPFLTQVSPRDSDFINLGTSTLKQRKDINHVSLVGEGPDPESERLVGYREMLG